MKKSVSWRLNNERSWSVGWSQVQFKKFKNKKQILPTRKASVAAKGITAQISPSFGSYTVSAVPMMKVPPTQVAAGKHTHAQLCYWKICIFYSQRVMTHIKQILLWLAPHSCQLSSTSNSIKPHKSSLILYVSEWINYFAIWNYPCWSSVVLSNYVIIQSH